MVEKHLTEVAECDLKESVLLKSQDRVLRICEKMQALSWGSIKNKHKTRMIAGFQRGNPVRAVCRLCTLSRAVGCTASDRLRIDKIYKALLMAISKLAGHSSDFCEWFVQDGGAKKLLEEQLGQLLSKETQESLISEETFSITVRMILTVASKESLKPTIKLQLDASLLMSLFNIWYAYADYIDLYMFLFLPFDLSNDHCHSYQAM